MGFDLNQTSIPKSLGVQTPEEFAQLKGGSDGFDSSSKSMGVMDESMFGALKDKLMTGTQVSVNNTQKDYGSIQPLLSNSKKDTMGAPIQYRVKDPGQYQDAINTAYKFTSKVPKGSLEAIANIESGFGSNASNQKNDVGKYGYLVGLTKSATDELKRLGISFNTDTPRGAFIAAARYLEARMKQHPEITDPTDVYAKLYKGSGDAELKRVYNYYHQNYSK